MTLQEKFELQNTLNTCIKIDEKIDRVNELLTLSLTEAENDGELKALAKFVRRLEWINNRDEASFTLKMIKEIIEEMRGVE